MSDIEATISKLKVRSQATEAAAAESEEAFEEPGAAAYRSEYSDGNPNVDFTSIGLATNDLDLDLDQVNDNLQDYGDNLSMEVNFGDGSSCRASDVSSLSFQNMVLDDPDADNLDSETVEATGSRRGSGDSSDSIPNDFNCDIDSREFSVDLEAELQKKVSMRESDPDRTLSGDEDQEEEDDMYDTGTMKRKNKLSIAQQNISPDLDDTKSNGLPKKCPDGQNCSDTEETSHVNRKSATESEYDASHSEAGMDISDEKGHIGYDAPSTNGMSAGSSSPMEHQAVKKRNSLEIRNNIPNVNEIKSYDGDTGLDVSRFQSQGAVPKMKKKSPGLARRLAEPLGEGYDRDTSSSEKEIEPPLDNTVISAQKMFETQLRNGNMSTYSSVTKSTSPKSRSSEHDLEADFERALREQTPTLDVKFGTQKNIDIENEYDYVKYARIQHGDSYVGMRLAYSSSNDSLNFNKNRGGAISGFRSDDDHYLGSSRETSPEKILQPPHPNSFCEQIRVSKVNEDTLTEIPLNGSDNLQNDEQKNFSLSPEATECDSAEVESVISEEGKSSTSGMPMVEDGLSSSQGSDTEDTSTMDTHRPAEILKRRYKAEINQEISIRGMQEDFDGRSVSSGTDSHHSTMSGADSDHQKDSVELAIKDIKTAIERSKNMQLKSPHQDDPNAEQEPVWVMRYAHIYFFYLLFSITCGTLY